MKKLFISLLSVLGLVVTSCSPYALVNSESYNNADLADYKTFHIVSPEEGHVPPGMQWVTYYNIAAAIREQMVERGYEESDDSPLWINIGLTVRNELQTAPVAPPNYYPYYGPLPVPPYSPFFMYPRQYYYSNAQVITGMYREGVLTMDFVNIDKKLPLYSASVATILSNGEGRFRNLSGINEAVQELFSKFPVKVLPEYK
ncbi:MAG: DUF4136 domain-containing protein [Paramuribaculum sp.]|nr:DUF4136 domain-containing protein [Paramuribaculum sp.]